jgi:hypothetical protein
MATKGGFMFEDELMVALALIAVLIVVTAVHYGWW